MSWHEKNIPLPVNRFSFSALVGVSHYYFNPLNGDQHEPWKTQNPSATITQTGAFHIKPFCINAHQLLWLRLRLRHHRYAR